MLEEVTTGMSDVVLVNSKFTLGVFEESFPSLRNGDPPQVLYPVVDLSQFEDVGLSEVLPPARFPPLARESNIISSFPSNLF